MGKLKKTITLLKRKKLLDHYYTSIVRDMISWRQLEDKIVDDDSQNGARKVIESFVDDLIHVHSEGMKYKNEIEEYALNHPIYVPFRKNPQYYELERLIAVVKQSKN